MKHRLKSVVLRATLRALGDAPNRSLTELAQRMGIAEAGGRAISAVLSMQVSVAWKSKEEKSR